MSERPETLIDGFLDSDRAGSGAHWASLLLIARRAHDLMWAFVKERRDARLPLYNELNGLEEAFTVLRLRLQHEAEAATPTSPSQGPSLAWRDQGGAKTRLAVFLDPSRDEVRPADLPMLTEVVRVASDLVAASGRRPCDNDPVARAEWNRLCSVLDDLQDDLLLRNQHAGSRFVPSSQTTTSTSDCPGCAQSQHGADSIEPGRRYVVRVGGDPSSSDQDQRYLRVEGPFFWADTFARATPFSSEVIEAVVCQTIAKTEYLPLQRIPLLMCSAAEVWAIMIRVTQDGPWLIRVPEGQRLFVGKWVSDAADRGFGRIP